MLGLFNDFVSLVCYMASNGKEICQFVCDDLQRIWKEMVVVFLKIL